MDTFLDVTGIVKRAKQALNFKNDSESVSYTHLRAHET